MDIYDAANAVISALPKNVAKFDRETMQDERNQRKGSFMELSTATRA
jgi:hypothetical protein